MKSCNVGKNFVSLQRKIKKMRLCSKTDKRHIEKER